jgi:hypothetical protein
MLLGAAQASQPSSRTHCGSPPLKKLQAGWFAGDQRL